MTFMHILAVVILITSWLVGAFFYGRALTNLSQGAAPITTAFLGTFASDDRFTPLGRRYRLVSLGFSLGGTALAILLWLLAGGS